MKNKLYLCLFGTGKTYLAKHYTNYWDLDLGCNGIIDPVDIQTILDNINGPVLLNISRKTINILIKYNFQNLFDIYVVLPEHTPEAKQAIINRCQHRPDHDTAFGEYVKGTYDLHYNLAVRLKYPKIYLKANQYLMDILDKDGNLKINETDN